MYTDNKYVQRILDRYRTHLELIDSIPINFTGTASERPAPCYTNPVDSDVLFFAGSVNFTNVNVLVRIKSQSPQYEWMTNNTGTPQDTPVNAVFGLSTQNMPVLPLIMPFFVGANGKLQMQFTNAASSAVTGGIVTWRALKLVDPIDGGWRYGL